jgi:hypothetical protein
MSTACVVALALCAVFAVSASAALPEFTDASGKTNMKFTLIGGPMLFETKESAIASLPCGEAKGEGAQTGKKTATATLIFKDCKYGFDGQECNSAGANAGEIKTGVLPVDLVYISKERKEAALIFNYHELEPKATFVKWSCDEGLSGELGVRGSIIAPITPINSQSEKHTIKFVSTTKGLQSPTEYETEAGKKATAFPEMALRTSSIYEEGDLKGEWIMTDVAGYGALEIKA